MTFLYYDDIIMRIKIAKKRNDFYFDLLLSSQEYLGLKKLQYFLKYNNVKHLWKLGRRML